jgi:hypothetical protein
LSTAYVLKEQMLVAIEQRHANERAYQDAINDWQRATLNPENHPRWMQFYANALRDALRKSNSRKRETLELLTTADWRALVYRELQADQWYEQPALPVEVVVEGASEVSAEAIPLALTVSSNGNGQHPATLLDGA